MYQKTWKMCLKTWKMCPKTWKMCPKTWKMSQKSWNFWNKSSNQPQKSARINPGTDRSSVPFAGRPSRQSLTWSDTRQVCTALVFTTVSIAPPGSTGCATWTATEWGWLFFPKSTTWEEVFFVLYGTPIWKNIHSFCLGALQQQEKAVSQPAVCQREWRRW